MFGPPGHAYVYLVYGLHCCMNVVTERNGHASAVLLRAVEPVSNVEGPTNGPGRLCRAMGIDRRLNAHDLTGDDFFIARPPAAAPVAVVRRPRIGVDYAGRWARRLLRFYIRGNPFVSKP
jgi:DNA-3-methyladenine glycosylase